ncbi:putative DNA helicase ino80 [Marasmius crinis-equi]|uniref:Chromatin-remodeling ATPase INO80 n=1 Tax=Marasmius crinis-equi TaxID=585013 RepID=A0ABR3FUR2_9AGAR
MSLSRILNDEPAQSPTRSPVPSDVQPLTFRSRDDFLDERERENERRRRPLRPREVDFLPMPEQPASPNYAVGREQEPEGVMGHWNANASSSSRSTRGHRSDRERGTNRAHSPDEPPYQEDPRHEEEEQPTPRKRRKNAKDDTDYRPPGQRRVSGMLLSNLQQANIALQSSRKSSQRAAKQLNAEGTAHRDSPLRHHTHPEDEVASSSRVDDKHLLSSDLEDCEEIWIGDLSEYILQTQRRFNQVEQFFYNTTKDRSSSTAHRLSHYYADKLDRMRSPPPPPKPVPVLPPPKFEDYPGEYPPPHDFDSDLHHYGPHDDANHELHDIRDPIPPIQTGTATKAGRVKEKRAVSDDDPEVHDANGRASKKRKVDPVVEAIDDGEGDTGKSVSTKGKGKAASTQDITPKGRKKPAPKKKPGHPAEIDFEAASGPPSIAGDITPFASRPPSPAPINTSVIHELDEHVVPLKKAKKMDETAQAKRVKALEEAQKKVWTNIARRDVAKVYKYHASGYAARVNQAERIAKLAVLQARRPFTKSPKATKDTQAKAKRLMREMQVFWRKNEREERDLRKREQKEANDRQKLEEERRESARQARKLEFLISQTELYSHFVGNKLKTAEVEGDAEATVPNAPAGADVTDTPDGNLQDINFDDEDQTNLYRHARHNAQEAIAAARQRAVDFDTQAALERKTNEAIKLAKEQKLGRSTATEQGANGSDINVSGIDLDSDELNFQNPTSLSGPLTIGQPKMLMAQLKEYQLKGLNWLATLYEQGINGILADEMGLGKTVQSISLLSYLAETHDIWGPFLVVAPASTLHNWQQEITRFVPGLKALPYWGNVKDRTTLRKFWSKKEISYNQDAPFHVLITSYQLVTQDQQYFQRVKWQYMILDEAQNIKNSSSVRWKTLLGFHCRNRLLLTGTPIQNSMQELWALLHFIMPSLFDSHDEFNEWFSKDIENAAENKGGKLNEHQLRRLHMILKPFMLRRVKKHVQNELSEKIEIDIYVDLSARQRALYKALLANVSVADLLEKAANIGDAESARSLMNLVMQFRKVCNHPELFERADVVSPFAFAHHGRSSCLAREGDFVDLPYSTQNPINLEIPVLMYRDGGILDVPREDSSQSGYLSKLMNIWSTDYIHNSVYNDDDSSTFAFLRIVKMSPQEAHCLHVSPLIKRGFMALDDEEQLVERASRLSDAEESSPSLRIHNPVLEIAHSASTYPEPRTISQFAWAMSCLSRPELRWYIPPAVAPPISLYCAERTFIEKQAHLLDAPLESLAFYGMPPSLTDSYDAYTAYQRLFPNIQPAGLMGSSSSDQLPLAKMQIPEAKRLIYDSAKLARLDSLLQELKSGGHRVLVYFQMTRMMDLMEEYLIYRQYKYLRLDGSSKIEDRRDMVIDWQTRPDIFVFLLSTRAGGLGINLTAADTVIFYDHDWNPSNDAQAMDRAHRLGQTRQVTVYRLITKGTIDERIVQLARVKKDVQDIVVGNKNFTDVAKPSEIVQLLLNDEQLAGLDQSRDSGAQSTGPKPPGNDSMRDLWNEEGDDFFGAQPSGGTGNTPGIINVEGGEDENTSTRGKKRKPATRGGRRGGKKRGGAAGVPS